MDAVPIPKRRDTFDRLIEIVAMGVLVAMVIEVGFSVFCRYVLSLTFRWSEEITVILFIFLIFLSIPIVFRQRLHICIDYFVSKMPACVCKVINFFVELIIFIVSLILVVTSFQVVHQLGKEPMSATYLPIGIIYGSVGVCGFLLAIVSIRSFFRELHVSGCEEPLQGKGE